jgi:hypothetical protein
MTNAIRAWSNNMEFNMKHIMYLAGLSDGDADERHEIICEAYDQYEYRKEPDLYGDDETRQQPKGFLYNKRPAAETVFDDFSEKDLRELIKNEILNVLRRGR